VGSNYNYDNSTISINKQLHLSHSSLSSELVSLDEGDFIISVFFCFWLVFGLLCDEDISNEEQEMIGGGKLL
jgi:hypothetical protein